VFELITARGGVSAAEMWEVFNMGCGFCVITPADQAPAAVELLASRHPGAAPIGGLTDRSGTVTLPALGLEGDGSGLRSVPS
jgi:phosphoribosylformylglycinamidine cyclo-ligase